MRNSDGSRKGNCHAHENKEENIGIKELENFSDNINLNAFPAKPDITHLLYQRLITNLQSDVLYFRQQLKTSDVFSKKRLPASEIKLMTVCDVLAVHQKRKKC